MINYYLDWPDVRLLLLNNYIIFVSCLLGYGAVVVSKAVVSANFLPMMSQSKIIF